MKNTYITPAMLTVQLGTIHMMAESVQVFLRSGGGEDVVITNSEDILTKEHKSVWDNEW